ncbi:MAG: S41 family peptidase [Chloroflexi bacterium]|nr:S41 family peptidase [Chloroflexota bacterium]
MNSNTARNALVGVLATVIAVLLVAVGGYLGGVVLDDDEPGATQAAVSGATDTGAAADSLSGIDFALIDEIIGILQEDFVEPDRVDRELLYEGAVNGLFQALGDPHSVYIDPQTYAVSRDDFSGAFQGIGATVSSQDGFVVIVRPLPSTPAEVAGIQAGDVVLAVDGEDAEGWSVEKAVLRIRGRRGSAIELTVRHPDGEVQTLSIVRDDILVASVDNAPPGGVLLDAAGDEATDIGYIRIRSFTSRTPDELGALLEELEGKVEGVIIDVRGNPGGLLVETALTADMFLDGGTILVQVDRDGSESIFNARPGMVTELPVAIVQDEFSASGSELLAAALQENGRGIVVGSNSFGKGTVNHARDLSNGGAVYVSIARWLTPDRNLIEGRGVIPDIEIMLTIEDIEAQRDIAIYRAIDALRATAEAAASTASEQAAS